MTPLDKSLSEGGYAVSSRRETWAGEQTPTPSPTSPTTPAGAVIRVRKASEIRCRKNMAGKAVAHHDLLL